MITCALWVIEALELDRPHRPPALMGFDLILRTLCPIHSAHVIIVYPIQRVWTLSQSELWSIWDWFKLDRSLCQCCLRQRVENVHNSHTSFAPSPTRCLCASHYTFSGKTTTKPLQLPWYLLIGYSLRHKRWRAGK